MHWDSNDKKRKIGLGFSFAWNGIIEALKHERNFQIHIVAAVMVIVIGLIVGLSYVEWAIVLLTIGIVLVAEMVNTAIEKTIDYLKPDIHPAAKQIKDMAAGAVFVAAIVAFIVGIIILLPKLINLFIL